jgi:geranylgeranyl pyrophosphate synthase
MMTAALGIGAILAEAQEKIRKNLSDLALAMGMAFQIQDDILDLKPTQEWEKEFGQDITEGKLTYMVADTVARAKDIDQKRLIKILTQKTKNRVEIEAAIALMDKYDAFSRAHELAEKLIADAKKIVRKIFPESDSQRIFLEILDFIIARKK